MVSFSSCSRLKFALVCGCLAASGIAFAKTCVWTGGAGTADWAAAGNWDQLPALGDTVVFQSSGSLTVDCPTSSQTWTTKVSNCIFLILKIVLFSRQRREKIARE